MGSEKRTGNRLTAEIRDKLRRLVSEGVSYRQAAATAGCSKTVAHRLLAADAAAASSVRRRSALRLSLADREEVSRGVLAGESCRAIAVRLGRAPSTITREITMAGGRQKYRAWRAEQTAAERARRPKQRKLDGSLLLRSAVVAMLKKRYSPQQIAKRLVLDYPADAEMRVSHETIYQTLYVQGRGSLRKELTDCLRKGRAHRRSQGRHPSHGQIPNMVLISERPAEVEDRAVPGHWEGDLILGKNNKSAIGTLVERKTRFAMLFALPNGRSAEQVRDAMTRKIRELPKQLFKSLTWDRGKEMSEHVKFTIDTGIQIYFCDPYKPWQRGSNENTNGLLRQYLPKGTDLSVHSQRELDKIAIELNGRPRMTLEWRNPAEVLAKEFAVIT
jgi:IS30 family transposase